jgi:hypothetical protein
VIRVVLEDEGGNVKQLFPLAGPGEGGQLAAVLCQLLQQSTTLYRQQVDTQAVLRGPKTRGGFLQLYCFKGTVTLDFPFFLPVWIDQGPTKSFYWVIIFSEPFSILYHYNFRLS